jgi:AmmeMemoRadiSam system protein B
VRKYLATILAILATFAMTANAQNPAIQELLNQVGLKSHGDQRGQMDTVGFAVRAEQMDRVIAQCREKAQPRAKELDSLYDWDDQTTFAAAVCPHDDYHYAGRLYQLLIPRVRAKRVVLLGVFHKARVFECRDKLVFDAFRTWHGPYGPVKVSPLREEILGRLPKDDYIVNNDMQTVEHSVEAIVPWLQAYNRDVEIVSILVSHMDWETLDRLATNLSDALAGICQEKGWRWGEDLALICSADAVHYGDADWGGSDYAPFGADLKGYEKAVERDLGLARDFLCGSLEKAKLKTFLYSCADEKDVAHYLITWCGRFSIPFGLNVAARLGEDLEGRKLEGILLDYGTSVSEESLDLSGLGGMGATAPNNLHHWVGYVTVGWK